MFLNFLGLKRKEFPLKKSHNNPCKISNNTMYLFFRYLVCSLRYSTISILGYVAFITCNHKKSKRFFSTSYNQSNRNETKSLFKANNQAFKINYVLMAARIVHSIQSKWQYLFDVVLQRKAVRPTCINLSIFLDTNKISKKQILGVVGNFAWIVMRLLKGTLLMFQL